MLKTLHLMEYFFEMWLGTVACSNSIIGLSGTIEGVAIKAKEFSDDFTFPDIFYFALDPNYSMVNKYGLRWDASKETAYPSTFVINKKGKIVYSKISSTHGGRTNVDEVVGALKKL